MRKDELRVKVATENDDELVKDAIVGLIITLVTLFTPAIVSLIL